MLKNTLLPWLLVLVAIPGAYANLPDFTDLVKDVSPAVVKLIL